MGGWWRSGLAWISCVKGSNPDPLYQLVVFIRLPCLAEPSFFCQMRTIWTHTSERCCEALMGWSVDRISPNQCSVVLVIYLIFNFFFSESLYKLCKVIMGWSMKSLRAPRGTWYIRYQSEENIKAGDIVDSKTPDVRAMKTKSVSHFIGQNYNHTPQIQNKILL